jgi:SAM-dependent methyltransferase
MNGFNDQVAQHYARTRYIPARESVNLVRDAICEIEKQIPIRTAADVGCGVGRFLKALTQPEEISVVHGYDISAEMLSQFRSSSTVETDKIRLHEANCALRGTLDTEAFDMILLHWVLNTTAAWHEILENCVQAIKPGGGLLWFQETGSLYDAIDRREELTGADDEFLRVFWSEFYTGLGLWGHSEILQQRTGLSMSSDLSKQALVDRGLIITALKKTKRTWTHEVTPDWLIDYVLVPKAFSNFWQIPERVFQRGLDRVYSLMARYPDAAKKAILLEFHAVPIVALRR